MNTLKFGNGEWYGKKDTILAYNDENSNFKPLAFNFERNTSATRVNKDGLIETVGSGEPRIDYKDDSKGALKLEPSRSNFVDNSTNFFLNSWSGTRVSEGSTIVSPNGQDEAHKLVASSVSNTHYREYTISSASSGSYTGSCFFKKGEFNVGAIRMSVDSYANRYAIYIDLNDGTFLRDATVGSPTGTSYKIENYGNGWYRLSVTITHTSGEVRMSLSNASSDYTNSNGLPVFLGNSSDGGYAWGGQLEQGSYATSYIPTQGSIVTRNQGSCIDAGNDQVFNDSEGAIFLNFASYGDYVISLDNKTSTNRIQFFRTATNDRIYIMIGGTFIINEIYRATSNGVYNKYALSYESGNILLYVNGSLLRTYTTPFTSTPFTKFSLNQYDDNASVSISMKKSKIYNTALTDQELINLTTI